MVDSGDGVVNGRGGWPGLFSPFLRQRFEASVRCPEPVKASVVRAIETAAGLPRPGTSGAANAFLILIGSEFGRVIPSHRPGYHESLGSAANWSLRIGQPNAHFDEKWTPARQATRLWDRLYRWLPEAFEGPQSVAHSMFCWANLSVTAGDDDHGTAASHRQGMEEHLGPLAAAACTRVLAATNAPTVRAATEWAIKRDATQTVIELPAEDRLALPAEDLVVLEMPTSQAPVLVARVGHPSRGVKRADFERRIRALLRRAEVTGEGH